MRLDLLVEELKQSLVMRSLTCSVAVLVFILVISWLRRVVVAAIVVRICNAPCLVNLTPTASNTICNMPYTCMQQSMRIAVALVQHRQASLVIKLNATNATPAAPSPAWLPPWTINSPFACWRRSHTPATLVFLSTCSPVSSSKSFCARVSAAWHTEHDVQRVRYANTLPDWQSKPVVQPHRALRGLSQRPSMLIVTQYTSRSTGSSPAPCGTQAFFFLVQAAFMS